jgi:acetyl/propionyl-CoA carboxylase alpha subunit
MIAKLIVFGASRGDALVRARDALARFDCQGIATTIGFHRMLVDNQAFIENAVHTRWIETEWSVHNDTGAVV